MGDLSGDRLWPLQWNQGVSSRVGTDVCLGFISALSGGARMVIHRGLEALLELQL